VSYATTLEYTVVVVVKFNDMTTVHVCIRRTTKWKYIVHTSGKIYPKSKRHKLIHG